MSSTALDRAFAPIAGADAELLILGSMPGRASLLAQRYYAHPRNAFWPIATALWQAAGDYDRQLQALIAQRIALWDVLAACRRQGSLDADIDLSSAVTNDFAAFHAAHPALRSIWFNGMTAQRLYLHRVGRMQHATLGLELLPSTSPAMAALSLAAKIERWRAAWLRFQGLG